MEQAFKDIKDIIKTINSSVEMFPLTAKKFKDENILNDIFNLEESETVMYLTNSGKFNVESFIDVINYALITRSGAKPLLYFGIYASDEKGKDLVLIVTEDYTKVVKRHSHWGTLIVSDNEIKYLLDEYIAQTPYLQKNSYGSIVNSELFRDKILEDIKNDITNSINYYIEVTKDLKYQSFKQKVGQN